jgi:very-short-patch-repair endonuclease
MHSKQDDERDRIHAWPDAAIGALAGRQRTNVTHAQLVELGVRARTIGAAVARGRLHRVHVGVYSLVAPSARPSGAGEQAALLACGATATLSHRSAARWHGFRIAEPDLIHVTVVGDRRRPGLRVHRTGQWQRHDVLRVGGIRVTSIARTVVDLSPHLNERALEHLLDEAVKRTSRARLHDALARRPAQPGTARLRHLLDPERPSSDTWSAAEERLLRLLRRAGIPSPEANVPIGQYIPDLLWRAEGVIVEYDSRDYHSGDAARKRDARRHNDLQSWGYEVIHVTWEELTQHPEQVLVWIVLALHRKR